MSTTKLNIFLVILFAVLTGFNFFIGRDFAKPNTVIFSNVVYSMVRSVSFRAFEPNPFLPQGKTLQPAPPHTIARGQMPLHYQATPQEALRAGRELHSPFSEPSAGLIERGRDIYMTYCIPCHGASGEGDGPVALKGFPPPASLNAPNAINMPDGQMFHVMTYGKGNMPSYASQIRREERWKVIAFIRNLQQEAAAQIQSATQATTAVQVPSATQVPSVTQ